MRKNTLEYRKALEALALSGYRAGDLSQGQVRKMLGLDYWETERFLSEHSAEMHYDEADLEEDRRTNERLFNLQNLQEGRVPQGHSVRSTLSDGFQSVGLMPSSSAQEHEAKEGA